MKTLLSGIVITRCALLLIRCGEKKDVPHETTFTHLDSLTDYYLALQDSMLQSWNVMIQDDNQKIKAMHNLLHELRVSAPGHEEALESYQQRLEQLERMRYTQKTMSNIDVVEEYDFASTSLVNELLTLAAAQPQFQYNTTLQKMGDEIRLADERVNNYRADYDDIVLSYNHFLEKYHTEIREIDTHSSLEKRPLFQMASEE